MEKLTADFNYKRYLTMYFYCTVFPLEKTKEGFFKCQLKAKQKEGGEEVIEWIIPAEYLGENGRVVASRDIFFARFMVKSRPVVLKDENGVDLKDKYGNVRVEERLFLSRLIEFWNTRVFGPGSDTLESDN